MNIKVSLKIDFDIPSDVDLSNFEHEIQDIINKYSTLKSQIQTKQTPIKTLHEMKKEGTREWFDNHKHLYTKTPCVNCDCDIEDNIIFHHIVPLSKGGSNHADNIVCLCDSCHEKVHNMRFGSRDDNWKKLQKEGIERAKQEGKFKGRKKIEKPDNWNEIHILYKNRQITGKKAMELTGLKRNTFYNFVKQEQEKRDNNTN